MAAAAQVFTAELAEKHVHNQKFSQFQFELVEPLEMEFQAGQYVSLAVSKAGYRRSYSIVSTPNNNHGFELFVDVSPSGQGTQFLSNLRFGEQVKVLGPLGTFVIQSQAVTTPVVFVATGAGVAPLRSMLYDQLEKFGTQRTMTLYWGLRHEEEMCWQEDLKDLVSSFPNVTFHPAISQASALWPLCHARVTDCLNVHELDITAEYYVCGSSQMIMDVMKTIIARGVPEAQIFREKFY